MTQEIKNKISKSRKGIIPWNKGLKGVYSIKKSTKKKGNVTKYWTGKKFTDEHRKKLSISKKGKTINKEIKYKGEKHWNWRGGITKNNKKIRQSVEYKLWRRAVFERDKYTCVWCGVRGNEKGGYLQADHIKPFYYYPELRFAIDNGRTLCKGCHKKTDTYGRKAIKYVSNNDQHEKDSEVKEEN